MRKWGGRGASDLGFQGLEAENDGFDTGARQFVLALQLITLGQQLQALILQCVRLFVQLAQSGQQAIHLAGQRLVFLF